MTSAKTLVHALIVAAAKRNGGVMPNRVAAPRVLCNQLRLEMDLSAALPLVVAGVLFEEAGDDNVTFTFPRSVSREGVA